MLVEKRRLGDILVKKGVITQAQLNEALQMQRLTPAPLGSILSHLGFVDEDGLVNLLAEEYGVPPWNLKSLQPDPAAIAKVPADIAKTYRVLPVTVRGETIQLAMSNPEDIEAIDMVSYTTRLKVEPVLAARHRLMQMIDRYYSGKQVDTHLEPTHAPSPKVAEPQPRAEKSGENATVHKLVDQIIRDAIRAGATDIHFEPTLDGVEVKIRVDGLLRSTTEILPTLQDMVERRLCHLAGLDPEPASVAQNGSFRYLLDESQFDLRLSAMPSHLGHRLVIKVLDSQTTIRPLDQLGFVEGALGRFLNLIHRPQGLVLITGPSGSGKTTTFYSSLVAMRSASRNVITVENPIEFDIKGISQSQVSHQPEQSYERQLEAVLSQNPDVIGIGEIRDEATTKALIRAALTGHLVIATLQSSDAVGAVARLVELGADPYLLANSICGLTSQRMLRKLCPSCVKTAAITPRDAAAFESHGLKVPFKIPAPGGCNLCGHTGFRGRVLVHEVVPVTTKIADLIAKGATGHRLREEAAAAGFESLAHRILDLVQKSDVSLEDARRVCVLDLD